MEKYIAPDRKRIPYGMMNFAVIRRDDCYYVDKTRFIPMIEEADKFFFFIRPRRFGKSLTVNMLQHYYDILAKDKFEALFGIRSITRIQVCQQIITMCTFSLKII